ncbi:zinc finger MYM-type protein 1-like [Tripterygium wilfordii]|uniref:zinc finger MYM-type protein 1-like n=1 Tax=Tripterygium wilfordii TaxID=458696 RepID=UPI0018F7EFE2|nr:zinc finger MYM-type protein 1-like [Tripterygium wilfordii]
MIDESRDMSCKEQMAVVLRYVDKKGHIMERFLGIQHVSETTAISLKASIEALFATHGLTISRLLGQGYDGASNMQGEFNGLKALILRDNPTADFVHCFAHQLQLALIGVTKNHNDVGDLFNFVTSILNVVGGSCKRRDILRDKQEAKIIEALEGGEISSGRGLNQETTLRRHGDTRWGSHYLTLVRLASMFSSVLDLLEIIRVDGSSSEHKTEAAVLLEVMQSFDFVCTLHLMMKILGLTNELSQALQRKDQDIENAMDLVKASKIRLRSMRTSGWDSLLEEVSCFCDKHDIDVPNMKYLYKARGRPRRNAPKITNLFHFEVELFNTIIDRQVQELDNRFTETTTELLRCIACLNPSDSFSPFNKEMLVCLAKFYPEEFSMVDPMVLGNQLETYIINVRNNEKFSGIKGIAGLAQKMVETKKNVVFPFVYTLITLALILPVATATVERVFSAMNIVKSRLRNRMGDKWMNDSLVVYIEKEIFSSIDNETIMKRFQNMKTRREELKCDPGDNSSQLRHCSIIARQSRAGLMYPSGTGQPKADNIFDVYGLKNYNIVSKHVLDPQDLHPIAFGSPWAFQIWTT